MIDMILKNIYKAGLCDLSASKREQILSSENYHVFSHP